MVHFFAATDKRHSPADRDDPANEGETIGAALAIGRDQARSVSYANLAGAAAATGSVLRTEPALPGTGGGGRFGSEHREI